MLDIDNSTESQLHIFEFLAEFKNPENERKRIKKCPFKILQAIFQITRTNENKGRFDHYPSKELIADVAGVSRKEVTNFVSGLEIGIFCDIRRIYDASRKKFHSNQYKLKNWVYKWLRLFWRSGMMKYFRTDYNLWLSNFKKRLAKWLVPLVQKGYGIDQIYEALVNKLSTKKTLKGAAAKSLKGAGINPTGCHEASGNQKNSEFLPSQKTLGSICQELRSRFYVSEGDINWLTNSFSLNDLKGGLKIGNLWLSRGMEIESPIKVMVKVIKEHQKQKNGRKFV